MTTFKHLLAAGLLGVAWMQPGQVNSQTPDVMRGLDSLKRSKPDPGLKPAESSTLEVQAPRSTAWLKPGMTEKEVTDILGAPDRIEPQKQSFRWYWDKAEAKGWVGFGSESHRVVEWRNP